MSRKKHLWTACRVKKFHANFWTAIQHCASLQLEEPEANIYVYKCDFCEGMHVTRGRLTYRQKRTLKDRLSRSLRVMSNIDFWYKADPIVVENTINREIELVRRLLSLQKEEPKED